MKRHLNSSLALAVCIFIFACKSGSIHAAASADISPAAPAFNSLFQTRNPRVCAKLTHVPSLAEATILVQCEHEAGSNSTGSTPIMMLATNVVVQMGSPKAFNPAVDSYWDNIDPAAKVIPLRGSSTGYSCIPVNAFNKGKNCGKSSGGDVGQGACWHTQFNEWRCRMTIGGKNQELNVNGPTTF